MKKQKVLEELNIKEEDMKQKYDKMILDMQDRIKAL